jgi:predicted RNA methylase
MEIRMQSTSTCHFTSRAAADLYFRDYGFDDASIQIAEGSIYIGEPPLRPGQTLSVIPGEGRYCINTPDTHDLKRPATMAEEVAMLTVRDNQFVLPETQLAFYGKIKQLIETSGGRYNGKGFDFPAGIDADLVMASLLKGKPLNGKKQSQSFFTPEDLAYKVVRAAGPLEGRRVLEPSAGAGALSDLAEAAGASVVVVENYRPNVLALRDKGYDPIDQDFLTLDVGDTGFFDAALMNPPFASGSDMAHVLWAYRFLKPGGVLSAITSCSWVTGTQKKQLAFLKFLQQHDAHMEEIAPGTFKESGTDVATMHIVIRKPQPIVQPEVSVAPKAEPSAREQLGLMF